MKVDNVSQGNGAAFSAAEKTSSSRDEFLRLLVAQLEHQNPLEPQTGSEFVAQLAQFASVEQSAEANKLLAEIRTSQVSTTNMAMAGFVGKDARMTTSEFRVRDQLTEPPELFVDVETTAADVEVVIVDANGNEVRHIPMGAQSPGEKPVVWDGTNDDGLPLAEGSYRIVVRAKDERGGDVTATTTMAGNIRGIDLSTMPPRLMVGSLSFDPSAILSIE